MAIIRRARRDVPVSNNNAALINTPEGLLDFASQHHVASDPLDLDLLAKELKIIVRYEPMKDDISGAFFRENDQFIISINSFDHPNRQRFTFAHELAHFCLHRHMNTNFSDTVFFRGGEQSLEEMQANNFASNLLMPQQKFFSQISEGNNTVQGLANFFQVSTLAVRVRAKQLGMTGHGL